MTVTFSVLLVLVLLTGVLAIIDGIARVRGRGNSALAVAEIVLAVLLIIVQFFALPSPFTAFLWSLLLEIVLVVQVVLGGRGRGRRGGGILTIVILVLGALVLLMSAGWLQIPRVN